MSFKVGVLVGSLRKESVNRKLADAIASSAPRQLQFSHLVLPSTLFNEELESRPPADWTGFREQVARSDALLFVTPEYNRSTTAVLKNAIDVASRPYGKSVLSGKPGAVVSASIGALGGALANHHVRQSLMFCNVPLLQQPEVYIGSANSLFDETGKLKAEAEATKQFLTSFGKAFHQWISILTHRH